MKLLLLHSRLQLKKMTRVPPREIILSCNHSDLIRCLWENHWSRIHTALSSLFSPSILTRKQRLQTYKTSLETNSHKIINLMWSNLKLYKNWSKDSKFNLIQETICWSKEILKSIDSISRIQLWLSPLRH